MRCRHNTVGGESPDPLRVFKNVFQLRPVFPKLLRRQGETGEFGYFGDINFYGHAPEINPTAAPAVHMPALSHRTNVWSLISDWAPGLTKRVG